MLVLVLTQVAGMSHIASIPCFAPCVSVRVCARVWKVQTVRVCQFKLPQFQNISEEQKGTHLLRCNYLINQDIKC